MLDRSALHFSAFAKLTFSLETDAIAATANSQLKKYVTATGLECTNT